MMIIHSKEFTYKNIRKNNNAAMKLFYFKKLRRLKECSSTSNAHTLAMRLRLAGHHTVPNPSLLSARFLLLGDDKAEEEEEDDEGAGSAPPSRS